MAGPSPAEAMAGRPGHKASARVGGTSPAMTAFRIRRMDQLLPAEEQAPHVGVGKKLLAVACLDQAPGHQHVTSIGKF